MKTEELIKLLDNELVIPSPDNWRVVRLAKYELEKMLAECDALKTALTDWRYSHDEIEAACGGEMALLVRSKVTARRVVIDVETSAELQRRSAAQPNIVFGCVPCMIACTTGFSNSSCYHEFMKADLRISIKDYRRSKNLKFIRWQVHFKTLKESVFT